MLKRYFQSGAPTLMTLKLICSKLHSRHASGSKVGSQSVKWATVENAVLEDKKIILQDSSNGDYDISERFTSAEACAVALNEGCRIGGLRELKLWIQRIQYKWMGVLLI